MVPNTPYVRIKREYKTRWGGITLLHENKELTRHALCFHRNEGQ